jgi:hypothetical protein
MKIVRIARICLLPEHLTRTVAIAIIVGSWLTLVNIGMQVLQSGVTQSTLVKILLNYLTPFVVSNWGLASRQIKKREQE